MAMQTDVDLAILGGGAAGYSAAIYAARANLSTVVFEQAMPGGQITTTDIIENYPGITSISGAELGMRFQEHAEATGAETRYVSVEAVSHNEDGSFNLSYDAGTTLTAKALIVASGAVPRPVGFKGEDTYKGRGVSYCATCDGMFYKDKQVFVIGGGNAACEEGLFLTNFASHVFMVIRRNEFRAPQGVVNRVLAHEKISVKYETSIVELSGDALPSTITFRNNATGTCYNEEFKPGSFGIFVFAGTDPVTCLVTDFVDLGRDGGIQTDESMATKTPGLFAAGDVRSKRLRQVITAASDGAIAATSAYEYIKAL